MRWSSSGVVKPSAPLPAAENGQRLELGVDIEGWLRKMGPSLAQTLASLEQKVLRSPDCRSAYRAVMITVEQTGDSTPA